MRFLMLGLLSLLLATVAQAETVDVKYRGPVSLDSLSCPSLKPSSFVNRICYDEANSYLIVQLKSTYYHYCDLPASVFADWVAAPSLGRYYNGQVKGQGFDCRGKALPVY